MKRVLSGMLALALAACSTRPVAHPLPPATGTEIAEAERLGQMILVHAAAAAQATDGLIRVGVTPSNETGVLGWITVSTPEGIVVRFVGENAGTYAALYDVSFSAHGTPSAKRLSSPEPLPLVQLSAFKARQLAIASASLDCAERYNTVVFQDPFGANGDWHVYLLPATTVPGRVMVGRQLRILVSADGSQVLENRALSKDCMYVDRSAMPPAAAAKAIFLTNLVTPTPNESHVFLSLHERMPFAVGTSLGAWMVADGRIRYLGPTNGARD